MSFDEVVSILLVTYTIPSAIIAILFVGRRLRKNAERRRLMYVPSDQSNQLKK